jgi:hypothetical protein
MAIYAAYFFFFASCGLFRIVDGISFIAKDRDGTSIQKLTEVHVNTSQKQTRVIWIKKKWK